MFVKACPFNFLRKFTCSIVGNMKSKLYFTSTNIISLELRSDQESNNNNQPNVHYF